MRMMAARSRLRAASRGSVGKSPRERDIPEAKKVFEDSGRDALYHTPRGDSVRGGLASNTWRRPPPVLWGASPGVGECREGGGE